MHSIFNIFKFILFLPFKLILLALWPVTKPAEKTIGKLAERILVKFGSGNGYFDEHFANHKNPLLKGNLLKAAEVMWPKSEHPTFYKKIPDDIRRSIVIDGRIRGSSALPAHVLPAAGITNKMVKEARQEAIKKAINVMILSAFLFFAILAYSVFHPIFNIGMPQFQLDANADYWSPSAIAIAKTWFTIKSVVVMFLQIATTSTIALTLLITATSIFSLSLAGVTFWGAWRALIFAAVDENAEPLRLETKESVVRWKHRLEQRELEDKAYLHQINEIEREPSPLIEIGEATGQFNFRGSLSGPRQHQKVKVAVSDLFENTIAFGGTGSGKTRAFFLPTIAQLIKLQADQDISLYVTDSKAVLWKDVAEIAKKFNREVQVIGVKDDEHGIDILDGIEPSVAADHVKSIMRQLGGASADSFWPDMAHNTMSHIFNVLHTWERTQGGIAYIDKTAERPYSLVTAYGLAMKAGDKKNSWMSEITNDILDCVEKNPSAIIDLADSSLYASLDYLNSTWLGMAVDTRSGIEANITNALGGFGRNVKLREKFASGERGDLNIRDCWGKKITAINLPEDLGVSGKIINVFLKTLLFNEAKRRQTINPEIRFKQQLAFIADEFQTLITADPNSTSDATFPNVCRSTGVFYMVATQGIVALEQSIGLNSTMNFLNNMRNKIFLQIEEAQTMDFAKKLAGKSLRFYTYDNATFESYESMRREIGFDPTLMLPATLQKWHLSEIGFFFSLFNLTSTFKFSGIRKKYVADNRYIASNLEGNLNASLESYKSAAWRAEDKNSDYMKSGNEIVDVLSETDLIQMGRSHAYAFVRRAGHNRQDIVQLQDISLVLPKILS